jgi:Protein of unknown function (DUF3060)
MGRTGLPAVLLATVLALAACGDDSGPEADPTAPPPAPPPTSAIDEPGAVPNTFNDEGAAGTFECESQNITVNGEDSDLHFTGPCGTVVVNGARSTVVVDDAEVIVVNGEEATVTYAGDPEVVVNGEGASAEPEE